MGTGFKKVTIDIPMPKFADFKALRNRGARREVQQRIYVAMKAHDTFYNLLSEYHGEDLARVILKLFAIEGPDSNDAETLLYKIVNDFSVHSPPPMFLYYTYANNLEKAIEHYRFWPMQYRFLQLVSKSNQMSLETACPNAAEEFDFLCEELGLAVTSRRYPVITISQTARELTGLTNAFLLSDLGKDSVTIDDILANSKEV